MDLPLLSGRLNSSALSGLRRVAVIFTRSRLTAFAFVGAFRAVALVQLPPGFEPMIRFAPFRPPLFLANPVRALANLVCVVCHENSLRCRRRSPERPATKFGAGAKRRVGGPFRDDLTMSLPRSIEIDGRRYVWRDLVASRCAHAKPLAEQPTCSRGATIAARLAAQRGRAIPRAEPVHPAGLGGATPPPLLRSCPLAAGLPICSLPFY